MTDLMDGWGDDTSEDEFGDHEVTARLQARGVYNADLTKHHIFISLDETSIKPRRLGDELLLYIVCDGNANPARVKSEILEFLKGKTFYSIMFECGHYCMDYDWADPAEAQAGAAAFIGDTLREPDIINLLFSGGRSAAPYPGGP